MINKITPVEKAMMMKYIETYATDDCGTKAKPQASIEYILREWQDAKSYSLAKLFNGELILSKHISFEKNRDDIRDGFRSMGEEARFIHDFYHFFDSRWRWEAMIPHRDFNSDYYNLVSLCSDNTLTDNVYKGETVKLEVAPGKFLTIQHGCKPVKAMAKIVKNLVNDDGKPIFKEQHFEEFRLKHSMILNDKTFKGELCLSIHPLDYMTMSDLNNGWASCMSWNDYGCYRQGTVEMMNSPIVIVAYLKSNSETINIADGYEWNKKNWRCLIVCDVSTGVVAAVKGYPQIGYRLQEKAVEWVSELIGEDKFMDGMIFERYHEPIKTPSGGFVRITFETNNMYNDFGSQEKHYMRIFKKLDLKEGESKTKYICYSGLSQCMRCGELDISLNDGEGSLICSDCGDCIWCVHCGDRIPEDEVVWIDGESWCDYCYNDYFYEDLITGDILMENEFQTVYLADEYPKDNSSLREFLSRSDNNIQLALKHYSNEVFSEYFKNDVRVIPLEAEHWFDDSRYTTLRYVISKEDCTEKGLELFEIY